MLVRIVALAGILVATTVLVGGVAFLVVNAQGSSRTDEPVFQLEPDDRVEISTARGGIVVRGGPRGVVTLTAQLTNAERVDYAARHGDEGVIVSATMDDPIISRFIPIGRPKVDVAAVLARDVPVDLESRNGSVQATALQGGGRLRAEDGDITLESASGDWVLEADNGDVRAGGVSGDVTVSARGGAIVLAQIAGAVSIEGEDAPVRVERAAGPILIETSSAPIDVRTVIEPVSENRLITTGGDIVLTVEGELDARIVAETDGGTIEVDGFEPATGRFDETVGDGEATIELRTTEGDIRVVVAGGR